MDASPVEDQQQGTIIVDNGMLRIEQLRQPDSFKQQRKHFQDYVDEDSQIQPVTGDQVVYRVKSGRNGTGGHDALQQSGTDSSSPQVAVLGSPRVPVGLSSALGYLHLGQLARVKVPAHLMTHTVTDDQGGFQSITTPTPSPGTTGAAAGGSQTAAEAEAEAEAEAAPSPPSAATSPPTTQQTPTAAGASSVDAKAQSQGGTPLASYASTAGSSNRSPPQAQGLLLQMQLASAQPLNPQQQQQQQQQQDKGGALQQQSSLRERYQLSPTSSQEQQQPGTARQQRRSADITYPHAIKVPTRHHAAPHSMPAATGAEAIIAAGETAAIEIASGSRTPLSPIPSDEVLTHLQRSGSDHSSWLPGSSSSSASSNAVAEAEAAGTAAVLASLQQRKRSSTTSPTGYFGYSSSSKSGGPEKQAAAGQAGGLTGVTAARRSTDRRRSGGSDWTCSDDDLAPNEGAVGGAAGPAGARHVEFPAQSPAAAQPGTSNTPSLHTPHSSSTVYYSAHSTPAGSSTQLGGLQASSSSSSRESSSSAIGPDSQARSPVLSGLSGLSGQPGEQQPGLEQRGPGGLVHQRVQAFGQKWSQGSAAVGVAPGGRGSSPRQGAGTGAVLQAAAHQLKVQGAAERQGQHTGEIQEQQQQQQQQHASVISSSSSPKQQPAAAGAGLHDGYPVIAGRGALCNPSPAQAPAAASSYRAVTGTAGHAVPGSSAVARVPVLAAAAAAEQQLESGSSSHEVGRGRGAAGPAAAGLVEPAGRLQQGQQPGRVGSGGSSGINATRSAGEAAGSSVASFKWWLPETSSAPASTTRPAAGHVAGAAGTGERWRGTERMRRGAAGATAGAAKAAGAAEADAPSRGVGPSDQQGKQMQEGTVGREQGVKDSGAAAAASGDRDGAGSVPGTTAGAGSSSSGGGDVPGAAAGDGGVGGAAAGDKVGDTVEYELEVLAVIPGRGRLSGKPVLSAAAHQQPLDLKGLTRSTEPHLAPPKPRRGATGWVRRHLSVNTNAPWRASKKGLGWLGLRGCFKGGKGKDKKQA